MPRLKTLFFFLPVLLLSPTAALADVFHTYVKYDCNQSSSTLTISVRGVYENDQPLAVSADGHEFYVGALAMRDKDGIVRTEREVHRQCPLKGATYIVRIGVTEGNELPQGACGGYETGWLEVKALGQVIYPKQDFGPGCSLENDQVISQVKFVPNQQPRVEHIDTNKFYGDQ